jgi:acetyltransferase-like isoleucine patch superfamily enzyme
LGDFSYFSDDCVILEATIGKFCSFGPNVRVAPGKHPTKTFVSTHPALFSNPPYCKKNFFDKDYHNPNRHVVIGNDVWICANVVIADGVKIGDGAIIAANAVVCTDVKPYTIVGGVPAKFIKNRFEVEEIKYLLDLQWWNKSLEWIEKHASMFLNINNFIKIIDNE